MRNQKTSTTLPSRAARVLGELVDAALVFGSPVAGVGVLVAVVWLARLALQLIGVVQA